MEERRSPSGVTQHLLNQLATTGASTEFWSSYWRLAPWMTGEESAHLRRAIGGAPGMSGLNVCRSPGPSAHSPAPRTIV
jgi:hypothetical protein